METTLLIAAMVAVFSWAATKEEIFKDLRTHYFEKWCKDQRLPYIIRKICYIPTCEYCFSFWFTVLVTILFRHKLNYDDYIGYHDCRSYILAHGVTWAIAVLYMSIYQLIRVDIRHAQAKADREKQLTEGSS